MRRKIFYYLELREI